MDEVTIKCSTQRIKEDKGLEKCPPSIKQASASEAVGSETATYTYEVNT